MTIRWYGDLHYGVSTHLVHILLPIHLALIRPYAYSQSSPNARNPRLADPFAYGHLIAVGGEGENDRIRECMSEMVCE